MSARIDFTLRAQDETELCCYEWPAQNARAAVVIVHGMAEHAARYGRFAQALNAEGVAVVSMDLRGHGATASGTVKGWFAKKGGWKLVLGGHPAVDAPDAGKIRRPAVHTLRAFDGLDLRARGAVHIRGSVPRGDPFRRHGGRARPEEHRAGDRWRRERAAGRRQTLGSAGQPDVRRVQQAFQAAAHALRLAEPRHEGSRQIRARRELRVRLHGLDVRGHQPRAAGNPEEAPTWQRCRRTCRYSSSPARRIPWAGFGMAAAFLEKQYKAAGLDAAAKVYEGDRHELLNETNRDEVTKDLMDFIGSHI